MKRGVAQYRRATIQVSLNHPYIIDIDYTRDEQGAVLLNKEGDREVPHQLLLEKSADTFEPTMISI